MVVFSFIMAFWRFLRVSLIFGTRKLDLGKRLIRTLLAKLYGKLSGAPLSMRQSVYLARNLTTFS